MERRELIDMARAMYQENDIEIDDDAKISVAEGGAWVQAWVWIPEEELALVGTIGAPPR